MVDTRRGEPLYALRFRANGRRQYVRLGTAADGWTRERAERELADTMALVRKGLWRPPDKGPDPAKVDPGFHQFASHWIKANEAGWRPNTRLDYRWQVEMHLLPFFKAHRLSQITIAEVDRYRAAKLAEERPLSATSINKTITRLGQILETAVEYGYIERNPARGKRRRVKATKPAPVWLDRAEQITALLDAATELDREASSNRDHVARRATLATFVFAGLRIGELTALRWRDVDLAANRITVRDGGGDSTSERAKTDAGYRVVDLLPVLRDTLTEYKAAQDPDSDALVFPSSTGRRLNPSNIRRRVLSLRRARQRAARHPRRRAVTGRADATQAAPLLRLPARGAGRRSPSRDGPARPHGPGVHAACLPARDATRSGVAGRVGRARRSRRLGSEWSARPRNDRRASARDCGLQARNPVNAGGSFMGAAGFEPATSRV